VRLRASQEELAPANLAAQTKSLAAQALHEVVAIKLKAEF
jgi:hypothetical protein